MRIARPAGGNDLKKLQDVNKIVWAFVGDAVFLFLLILLGIHSALPEKQLVPEKEIFENTFSDTGVPVRAEPLTLRISGEFSINNAHNYTDQITAPTCTEQGYTTHTCAHCGDSYVDSYVEALGHKAGEWKTDIAATCTADGERHLECAVCGASIESEPIQATGHRFEITYTWTGDHMRCTSSGRCRNNPSHVIMESVIASSYGISKMPTCTEAGEAFYTVHFTDEHFETQTCVREMPSHGGHDYEEIIVPPTCTNAGYTAHSCRRCRNAYYDTPVEAFGHTEVIDPAVAATCTEHGWTEGKHCSVCNAVLERQKAISPTGHIVVEVQGIAPTCTEPGVTDGTYCSICCAILVEQIGLSATGHTEVYRPATEPTCTSPGWSEEIFCPVCMTTVKEAVAIPATGHMESEWIIDIPAKPGVKGHRYTECTVCRAKLKEETIPAISEETSAGDAPFERSGKAGCAGAVGSEVGMLFILMALVAGWNRKLSKHRRNRF